MKSIRTKAIIALLLISVVFNVSMKREETMEGMEMEAKSAKKGTWETRLLCADIKLAKMGGTAQSQGEAYILGKKFLDEKEGFNSEGIYLEFEKGLPRDSEFKEIYIEKAVNKYVIPWRNIYPRAVSLTNYPLNSKTIKLQIMSDRNNEWEIQILLPYAYIGNYVTLDQAGEMVQRIRQKSEQVSKDILKNQEQLNILFPQYRIKHEAIQDSMKDAAEIEKRIQFFQKDIMRRIAENTSKKVTLQRLEQESIAHNIKAETLKGKLMKEKKAEQLLYSEKGALHISTFSLKNSLKNPTAELARNKSQFDNLKKETIPRYAKLLQRAPIQTTVIEASKAGFLTNNDKEFLKLHQVYP